MNYLENLFSLKGKVALVTGGGRGIGQVIAQGLAQAGAEIAIIDLTAADETVELVRKAGGKAYSLVADVTGEDEVNAALKEIISRSGALHIVFNNAGISIQKEAVACTLEEWRRVIDINLTGVFVVARAAGKLMIEKGIKGSIINMGSMSGSIVNVPQWQVSYNSSKAAVIHMTRSLAVEWAPHGIRVNSLSPGYIATPMTAVFPKRFTDAWESLIPVRRMGKPEELISAIIYLAADSSSYTNGCDLVVDGAYTCF